MDNIIKICNEEIKVEQWKRDFYLWYIANFFVKVYTANPNIDKYSSNLKLIMNNLNKKLLDKFIKIYTIKPTINDLILPKFMMKIILLENNKTKEEMLNKPENYLIKTLEENSVNVLLKSIQ